MKYIVLALLVVGCTNSEPESTNLEMYKLNEAIDSLIVKSERNADSAAVALTKTDSVVVQKVEKTVQKIQHLETENKQLKEENEDLKAELTNTKPAGKPYKLLPVSRD